PYVAEVGGGGRLVDDLPLPLPLHEALDGTAHEPGAGQVHGEHAVEVGERVLGAVEVVVDGGVVDQHVDAPEALDGGLGERPGAGLVGDIDARAQRGGAERGALGGHGARLLVAD